MPGDSQPHRRIRFGVFEVDLRAREIRKQGLKIRLQNQPFQVLTTLLERPGEVVTREELQKKLWPADTFVDFDHGLNKAISKIRDVLGDSAENPRFLETVSRTGYRFLADVRVVDPAATPEASVYAQDNLPDRMARAEGPSTVPLTRSLVWKIAAAFFVVVLAIAAGLSVRMRNRASSIRSLAVLPLESLSNDASQDYFADGMTDELITNLGQIRNLRVISRTSVAAYKGAHRPLPEIARELGVDAIVEGTVLRSGDRVRITAQLIEAAEDKHLWSQSYEGELQDTLALQNRVARAIADEIQISLSAKERAALKTDTVINPEAYESYLKGRYFWNKRTADGLKSALTYFQQATEKDPAYARAYSGLADTYALLGDWQYQVMPAKEALPKAKAAAMKALELDDTLGEAHNSLGFCLDGYDWNFQAAGKEFQRAIELNPGYAPAHHWYAWHLALVGKNADAIAEMKRALNLDPLSLIINADLAELFLIAHDYDAAIQQSRKTLELDPNFALAHNLLGQAYLKKQQNDAAIAELQTAVRLSPDSPVYTANLARAYVAAGKNRDALTLLDALKRRSTPLYPLGSEIASVYAALGDNQQAMEWLEKSYAQRFNPGVLLRPGFDSLRPTKAFQDLLRRIGLPQS